MFTIATAQRQFAYLSFKDISTTHIDKDCMKTHNTFYLRNNAESDVVNSRHLDPGKEVDPGSQVVSEAAAVEGVKGHRCSMWINARLPERP